MAIQLVILILRDLATLYPDIEKKIYERKTLLDKAFSSIANDTKPTQKQIQEAINNIDKTFFESFANKNTIQKTIDKLVNKHIKYLYPMG